MTLTFNILMAGALTGASFTPARALGPMVATGNFTDAWLYLTAPILRALVAGRCTRASSDSPEKGQRQRTRSPIDQQDLCG
jgi:glycerol uptake facilitator-like aquaporin